MATVMTFEVGTDEKHTVVYTFDKFWGGLTITVDGNSIVDTVRFASLSLVKSWQFEVGSTEKHHVQIDKHRSLFFSGFRPQPVFGYVDGVLVAQNAG